MNDIEQRARELLAAEYVKKGRDVTASLIRRGEWDELGVGALAAALSQQQAVPDGFVLVPEAPTIAMLDQIRVDQDYSYVAMERRYTAMLAARPEVQG